ncbi:hypothetical protein [Colwellia sp. Bg11-28]|uniref:hypothetical protein n=1 Tax=Colwellia sp. Bg11-28 TaxID=2058305 RepID=UPI000C333E0E|nr:hypothetical protein [Colwellia sp. Bg11-28]PKH88267.1 hypothetical protein CXF79_05755 [Colwellia sp. Bg11-28]
MDIFIQYSSGIVILVTILKATYDFLFSSQLYKSDRETGLDILDALDKKNKRDNTASWLALVFITAISLYVLKENIMNGNPSREEFNNLIERIEKLENPLDPTGGGPNNGLQEQLDELKGMISTLTSNSVTKQELDDVVERVAEIKEKINMEKIALPSGIQLEAGQ